MSGVILAGGEGKRRGRDKTEIVLAREESVIETIISTLSTAFEELLILIQDNNLRIYAFYPEVRTRIVKDEKSARYDPEKLSFFNVTTRRALHEAHTIHKSLVKRENCTL